MGPKYLTDQQIEDILTSVPDVTAATTDISNKIKNEICDVLRLQLRYYKIEIESIPELKNIIINQFNRSVIEPGEPIGITCGEAIGAPMTQLNLNTFHQAGSSKTISISTFKELFRGTPNRKDQTTTIHFKNKNLSFEEVLEFTQEIIGVSIGDLVKSGQIFEYDKKNEDWWYNIYKKTTNKHTEKSSYFLRIVFDINLLYKYKITLNDIIFKLESDNSLNCIPSPISMGIIDIFLVEKIAIDMVKKNIDEDIRFISDERISLIFLQQIVFPNLGNHIIKGIFGIKKLFPIMENILYFIRHVEMIENNDLEWILYLDLVKIRSLGIPLSKIYNFLESANIEILNKPKKHTKIGKIFEDPYEEIVSTKFLHVKIFQEFREILKNKNRDYTIFTYLKDKIFEEEKKINFFVNNERAKGKIFPIYNYSEFYRSSMYVYAEIFGFNLKKLLSLDIIDSFGTISNNPHEMLSIFGIEATRNFYALNFNNLIISAGENISPRYVFLVSDVITNKGIISAVTPKGVSIYNRGAFAEASFQSPLENFVKSAISGKKEPVLSTSTCIFFGKRIPMGTGIPQFTLIEDVLHQLDKIDVTGVKILDLKNDTENIKIKEQKIVFNGENEESFITKIKIPKDEENEQIFQKFLLKKKIKKVEKEQIGGDKGPIPDIIPINLSSSEYNSIILRMLNNVKKSEKDYLPVLSKISIDDILEEITLSITEREKKIHLISIKSFIDSMRIYNL